METRRTNTTFRFDPYWNVKVVQNLDNEILVISRQRIKSILHEAESSLGKRDLWVAPFTQLVTLVALFVTTDFKRFVVSADTWRAFFMMLSLSSVLWLFWGLRRSLKCKGVDDILDEFMQGNIPYSVALRSAPRVVETYPGNGEMIKVPRDGLDVTFAVTYDQVMAPGYAWCTTENAYPERISDEGPHWSDDGKTCKLKMRVYPDLKYSIRFNVRGKFEGFRSVDGVPAEPYLLEFETVELTEAQECGIHT